LAYLWLTPKLKEKLENHFFYDVSQVLQQTLDCESRAKESISFSRSSEIPKNERHINAVEYSSESSADPLEEIDIGDGITPRPTFLNRSMSLEHRDAIIKLLRDYVDCFT
jgi:hypothetical protein